MKTKHFLSIVFFLSLNSFGQTYLKMTNDSIFWDIHYAQMGNICYGYGGGGVRLCFSNDTNINGKIYTNFKSYQIRSDYYPTVDCPPFHVDTISINTSYYIHEDSLGRIYVYNSISQNEFLLFDYNLQVADSIYYYGYGYFYIDSITNIITADGVTRKQYFDFTSYTHGYFIEGIGGAAGPIYPPFYYFENGPWLECWWYLNSNLHYCSDFYSNSEIVNIINNNLSIFPNPCFNIINFSNISGIKEIKIIDILGAEVYKSSQIKTSQINIGILKNGIYFIEFKFDDNQIFKSTIIKNSL